MEELFRYAPVIVNVLSLLISGISAGVATAAMVESALYEPPRYEPLSHRKGPIRPTGVTKSQKQGDYKVIMARNPFCSWCEPVSEEELAAEEKGEGKTLATLEGAELVATMVAYRPEHSVAVILITQKYEGDEGKEEEFQKPVVVSIGDAIGDAVVKEIQDKRVIFQQGNEEKELSLISAEAGKDKPKAARNPKKKDNKRKSGRNDILADLKDGIHKIGTYKYEIERSTVDKFMTNMAVAARGVKIMPAPSGGFKFRSVRPYSVFYKLGLRSGDVVKAVNNTDLNSVDQALALYTKFKSASHLTISVERRGKPITFDYTIR